jgi:hypothetical protein
VDLSGSDPNDIFAYSDVICVIPKENNAGSSDPNALTSPVVTNTPSAGFSGQF